MKIGILEPGFAPDELRDKFKSYPKMLEKLLGDVDSSLEFETWTVLEDVFPASINEADGWVVMGSKHGVYENAPWMIRLQDFLREAVNAGQPVFGICFGHQILATALGGKVVKSDKGWGVGVHEYDVTAGNSDWLSGSASTIRINAFHQDQVVELPEGATVWASSDFCPYAGVQYGSNAASIQPHPEFMRPYEQALLESRLDLIPADVHKAAMESLETPISSLDFAKSLVAFMTRKRARDAA
ncbi:MULTISPECIES: glutamine amidotransferase-related protein [Thalassospira]|uniref:Glutamine amidotransferase n=2 Tax=Thalassospira TaxID=168934 RepID=A0A367WEF5_9PROT|nr:MULTISPECIES: gamma-glutamyl-gamma-aminobutyrate hydrolase family protein [Thalassospira]MDG4718791.1 gamma-glutamyl-gamma-aminobutyrate hydrolase family protein [Thalassospira sp. FZY0004]RCK39767.1 glutamine amidotransferase [Thalassospira profundimaris]